MTRTALLAAVVSAALLPLSAFAHGGGHGGGGGGGGGHAGGGHSGGSHGGSHASSHAAAHASGHPHPHHHAGAAGGSSHVGKPSVAVTNAALATAARPASQSRPATTRNQFAKNHPRRHEVNQRQREQLARIREGLKSGKLTPAQAKQLLANDRSIKQQERADVKANGGHLTKAEQKQFNQEENANSRLIRADEHPATAAKPAVSKPAATTASRPGNPVGAPGSRFAEHHPRREGVNRRERDQQARIEEGLRSGRLSPAQAKQLLANDKSIKQQERADVKANGGYLTKAEQKQFNREENANSRLIRADEHPATP